MAYVCPRMYALSRLHQEPIKRTVDADLAWIFGTGTAIHTHWQNDYLLTLGDVFQGWWDSEDGLQARGERLDGPLLHKWIPSPGPGFQYVELEFTEPRLRLTGHCDGILCWPDEDPEVLELKTISNRGFDYVNSLDGFMPRAEHVLQVHAYLLFTGLERARLVYISKDLNKSMMEGISEHVVMRDDRIIHLISEMLEKCISVLDHPIKNLTPVETQSWVESLARLPECETKKSRRAINCAMKGYCFQGDLS